MSFGSGWDYADCLDDMLYPNTKWEAIKFGLITLVTYPIIIFIVMPLAYTFSFILGFSTAGQGKKCDRCGKKYQFTIRNTDKFYDFCPECDEEHQRVLFKFLDEKEVKE